MNMRRIGPPRIPLNPMSLEEQRFAVAHNAAEYKDLRIDSDGGDLLCTQCFISNVDESPDTLNEIRRLRLQQEFGVENDFRCVKCRECTDCKDSDKVEFISLKEEAEMELVDRSVELDMDRKQIICTLPLHLTKLGD